MEKAKIQIEIKHSIVVVHGIPVMLASNLAKIYGTSVSLVNLYRKRNTDRFTDDYAFQLSPEEWEILKLQNAISSAGHGGSRHLPWAYDNDWSGF